MEMGACVEGNELQKCNQTPRDQRGTVVTPSLTQLCKGVFVGV